MTLLLLIIDIIINRRRSNVTFSSRRDTDRLIATRNLIPINLSRPLRSHRWFKEFTNGTVLQEAVKIGREGHRDCGRVYRECLMTPRVLKSMMVQLGAM